MGRYLGGNRISENSSVFTMKLSTVSKCVPILEAFCDNNGYVFKDSYNERSFDERSFDELSLLKRQS